MSVLFPLKMHTFVNVQLVSAIMLVEQCYPLKVFSPGCILGSHVLAHFCTGTCGGRLVSCPAPGAFCIAYLEGTQVLEVNY